uniref:Uncharacterized protein n=1 Tax=Oryza sativa subsp. japonica TaxID=39947 RepID=Q6ZHT9_ORYSJ|nr:hypothetical protein [Oryza sativa Japonica Group]
MTKAVEKDCIAMLLGVLWNWSSAGKKAWPLSWFVPLVNMSSPFGVTVAMPSKLRFAAVNPLRTNFSSPSASRKPPQPAGAASRRPDLGIFRRTRFWVKKGGRKSNRFPMAATPIVVVDGRAARRARRGSQRRRSPMRAASRKNRFDWAQKARSD